MCFRGSILHPELHSERWRRIPCIRSFRAVARVFFRQVAFCWHASTYHVKQPATQTESLLLSGLASLPAWTSAAPLTEANAKWNVNLEDDKVSVFIGRGPEVQLSSLCRTHKLASSGLMQLVSVKLSQPPDLITLDNLTTCKGGMSQTCYKVD